ncbi:hypothetical protein FH972_026297 [Carpinus fangiana]|uniref:Uncharacterized protein n=1 Tax=Carpinus fangiana TaxID=176857 RepID=A0A5N6L438_9ROSI|nr:hypothetical protein FH972_026297 [Carpinus fangiana]
MALMFAVLRGGRDRRIWLGLQREISFSIDSCANTKQTNLGLSSSWSRMRTSWATMHRILRGKGVNLGLHALREQVARELGIYYGEDGLHQGQASVDAIHLASADIARTEGVDQAVIAGEGLHFRSGGVEKGSGEDIHALNVANVGVGATRGVGGAGIGKGVGGTSRRDGADGAIVWAAREAQRRPTADAWWRLPTIDSGFVGVVRAAAKSQRTWLAENSRKPCTEARLSRSLSRQVRATILHHDSQLGTHPFLTAWQRSTITLAKQSDAQRLHGANASVDLSEMRL